MNTQILKVQITTLLVCLPWPLLEWWQRGWVSTACWILLLSYSALLGILHLVEETNFKSFKKSLKIIEPLLGQSSIACLTVATVAHLPMEEFRGLLIPLTPIILLKLRDLKTIVSTNPTVALYLTYCLWLLLVTWVNQTHNNNQNQYYLTLGGLALGLGLLMFKAKVPNLTLGYTIASIAILTAIGHLTTEKETTQGLLVTYKNFAGLLGTLALTILCTGKKQYTQAPLNITIIIITLIATLYLPSQIGRLSSLLVLLCLGWFFVYNKLHINKKIQKTFLYTSLATLLLTMLVSLVAYKDISEMLGRKETIGGRTKIWEVAWDWTTQSPATGHGPSFWTEQGATPIRNSHHEHANRGYNGFLDTFVQSGAISVLLLISILFYAPLSTRLSPSNKAILILFGFLCLITETHSFSGTFLNTSNTTARAILVLWLAYCIAMTNPTISAIKWKWVRSKIIKK
jgi:hypothetical protein